MGLLNNRNIAKAKALAEKNKEKIASGVNKATDAIDKKTGGKHADKLKKIDDAAKKFAGEEQTSNTAPTTDRDTTTPSTTDRDATTPSTTGRDATTPSTTGRDATTPSTTDRDATTPPTTDRD